MAHNVRETLNDILQAFESGNIPEAIAHSMFPIPDLPSSKWSFLNRITIFLSGTADARGFRQWTEAGRHVKKGARAIYILVPRLIKRETDSETGEPEEQEVLAGFMGRPVFRVEDTEGEPLDYEQLELPPLPLMERAREWGLSVKAVPGNYQYHGYFSQDKREDRACLQRRMCLFPRACSRRAPPDSRRPSDGPSMGKGGRRRAGRRSPLQNRGERVQISGDRVSVHQALRRTGGPQPCQGMFEGHQ
jgi:hypothetical protein